MNLGIDGDRLTSAGLSAGWLMILTAFSTQRGLPWCMKWEVDNCYFLWTVQSVFFWHCSVIFKDMMIPMAMMESYAGYIILLELHPQILGFHLRSTHFWSRFVTDEQGSVSIPFYDYLGNSYHQHLVHRDLYEWRIWGAKGAIKFLQGGAP